MSSSNASNTTKNSTNTNNKISTVFFDLDGTLIDSALDFHDCLNKLLAARAKPSIELQEVKMVTSNGSLAMLQQAFKQPQEVTQQLQEEFLELYQCNMNKLTKPFEGVLELLDELDRHYIKWGIVTNKPEYLTLAALVRMQLLERASIVVCGDTLDKKKPHPDQLLYACEKLNVRVDECLFIGDAEVDLKAGKAANMRTALAMFGYTEQNQCEKLEADYKVANAKELCSLILRNAKVCSEIED